MRVHPAQVGAYTVDGSDEILVSTADSQVGPGLNFVDLSTSASSTCYFSGGPIQTRSSCSSETTTVKILCNNLLMDCQVAYSVSTSYKCITTFSAGSRAVASAAILAVAGAAAVL